MSSIDQPTTVSFEEQMKQLEAKQDEYVDEIAKLYRRAHEVEALLRSNVQQQMHLKTTNNSRLMQMKRITDRKPYERIPESTRALIIQKVLMEASMTWERASRIFKVSKSSIGKIIREERGRLESQMCEETREEREEFEREFQEKRRLKKMNNNNNNKEDQK
jgi:hypothetical protein